MKVAILCGGKGTRIRGVADDLPKPMIPIGAYPILWHIMQGYATQGHKDFVLCLGYKSGAIKDFFLNYRSRVADFTIDFDRDRAIEFHGADHAIDWRVTMAETGEETLTGSRVKAVEKYIGKDDTFMLTYGDGVADIDIEALTNFHQSHGKAMTVCGVRPPGRFGEMEHGADGAVIEFNEKPQATGGRISGGFFVCSRRVFDYLDGGRDDIVLETEPMRRLAADGEMMMYRHDGFWQCMDTYRDFQLLNDLFASGTAPWVR
ncbi:MAG TPA: glucose-1-phosphate cytidylyltransferase [Rhodospirillaceae bacterium]|nr:glucose-1-phosphate cytidylyltransferase [Rhodospirillaceae bacterium]|tara:strand:+ start:67640 stop:68422 length:783 start_codon:yes stop_codon:yes gene_type:complete